MSLPLVSRRALVAAALGTACGKPKAARISGFCFVANRDSRSVAVVDLSRFRLRTRIALDAAPSQIVAWPSQARAYVLAPEAAMLYEIDALTLSVSRRIRLGNAAVSMQLGRTGDSVWVLLRDPAALVEVPLAKLQPNRRIALSTPADSFDLAPEADLACLVTRSARTVTLASIETATITRVIAGAAEPSIACFRKDARQLITGSEADRSLTIYDCATGRVVVRLPLALAPRHFCTTADGGQLYITGDGMDAVVTVYPYRTEVAETRLAGRGPGAMAVTETNPGYLMVANPSADCVTVLDVDSGKLVALVQVGKGPGGIVITPHREYALVLNETSGDLAVIRIYSLGGNQEGGVRVKRYKSAPLFSLIPVGQGPVSAAVVTF